MLSKVLSFILRFAFILLISFFVAMIIPMHGEYAASGRLALASVIWFFGLLWCSMDFHKPLKALREGGVGRKDEKYNVEKYAKEKRRIEDEILRVLKLKDAGVLTDEDADGRITALKVRYKSL